MCSGKTWTKTQCSTGWQLLFTRYLTGDGLMCSISMCCNIWLACYQRNSVHLKQIMIAKEIHQYVWDYARDLHVLRWSRGMDRVLQSWHTSTLVCHFSISNDAWNTENLCEIQSSDTVLRSKFFISGSRKDDAGYRLFYGLLVTTMEDQVSWLSVNRRIKLVDGILRQKREDSCLKCGTPDLFFPEISSCRPNIPFISCTLTAKPLCPSHIHKQNNRKKDWKTKAYFFDYCSFLYPDLILLAAWFLAIHFGTYCFFFLFIGLVLKEWHAWRRLICKEMYRIKRGLLRVGQNASLEFLNICSQPSIFRELKIIYHGYLGRHLSFLFHCEVITFTKSSSLHAICFFQIGPKFFTDNISMCFRRRAVLVHGQPYAWIQCSIATCQFVVSYTTGKGRTLTYIYLHVNGSFHVMGASCLENLRVRNSIQDRPHVFSTK